MATALLKDCCIEGLLAVLCLQGNLTCQHSYCHDLHTYKSHALLPTHVPTHVSVLTKARINHLVAQIYLITILHKKLL